MPLVLTKEGEVPVAQSWFFATPCTVQDADAQLTLCCFELRPPEGTEKWPIEQIFTLGMGLQLGTTVHAVTASERLPDIMTRLTVDMFPSTVLASDVGATHKPAHHLVTPAKRERAATPL